MKRILSGMQPTSNLHLGNYLGAVKNWVNLQNEGAECLYMVADLHAITVPQDPAELHKATREIAAAYIASGIDPEKSSIFVQSHIPAHSQLMWLLATMAQMGKLERMTQFKDKAGKDKERVGLGLFAYPVLMAADILLYKATHVPVGEDQKQHLELTRELASTFNTRFDSEILIQPEPFITGPAPRVMSLRDGAQKMSKSAESDMTRINLTDDADLIVKKIRKAKMDMEPALPANEDDFVGRPEVKNLYTIYAALADVSMDKVFEEFGGRQEANGVFKSALADVAIAHLGPLTKKMKELCQNIDEIDKILETGRGRAQEIAAETLKDVQVKMGF